MRRSAKRARHWWAEIDGAASPEDALLAGYRWLRKEIKELRDSGRREDADEAARHGGRQLGKLAETLPHRTAATRGGDTDAGAAARV